jgi:dihydrolipoamide dehydrogenase
MFTDLIIIGAGPGGYETALYAAGADMHVVLIEEKKVGGTCLNEGCIPTKALCRNAEVLATIRESERFGVNLAGAPTLDFSKVMARKDEVVNTLRTGVESLLNNPLIKRVQGHAAFENSRTVVVAGAQNPDGTPVEEKYTSDHIIVATGSVTKFLPVEGAHLSGVLTSTDLLSIDHVPQRLCIIGGGVIGMEFASVFNSFGSEVTVVEFCKEILPNFDADIAKRLRLTLKGKGINFFTSAGVTAIREAADGNLEVVYDQKGKTLSTVADTVLMAVGRGANTGGLNLEAAGLTVERRGIAVDDNMLTAVPGIYAIGDVNGRCMLAHAATFQGRRAVNHILGRPDNIRLDIIPAAVFTSPEGAMVGLTDDQCKAAGKAVTVHKALFRANGKALAMGETDGLVKIVADECDRIVGCHLFGPHAADLVQEIAALMNKNVTIDEFREIIHGHPTLGEVVQAAGAQ